MPKGPKLPHAQAPLQLRSGRWQGRVFYYTEDGKRHESNKMFDTKREANAWSREREQWLAQHPNQNQAVRDETFGPFLDRWLATHQSRVRESTAEGYRYAARHAKDALGTIPITKLTPMDFQNLYQSLRQAELASSTIRQVHVVCRQAMEMAADYGLIPANPAAKAKPPRVTQKPITPPTQDQSLAFYRVADGHRWKALWYFIALTGCRRGEAIGLRWSDVDWDRKTATIRTIQSGKASKRREKGPKTIAGARTIALSDFLVDIMLEHREEQRTLWAQRPGPAPEWAFTTRNGTWIAGDNLRKTFKRLLKRANLPETTRIHDLRHAMATQWLARGESPKVVQARLGHANIAITLQMYTHVMPGMEHQAANRMDDWLQSESKSERDSGQPDPPARD